jgi:transcriptional regulator
MYIPGPFAEHDAARIAAFVAAHPLATLVSIEDGRPVVDHLPVLCADRLAPGGTLIAHTSKSNPTWRLGERGAEAVVAFTGASAYVSPSFYPSKLRTHEVVPTWNYVAVHVRGTLACTHDRDTKRQLVEQLTRHMESPRPRPARTGRRKTGAVSQRDWRRKTGRVRPRTWYETCSAGSPIITC